MTVQNPDYVPLALSQCDELRLRAQERYTSTLTRARPMDRMRRGFEHFQVIWQRHVYRLHRPVTLQPSTYRSQTRPLARSYPFRRRACSQWLAKYQVLNARLRTPTQLVKIKGGGFNHTEPERQGGYLWPLVAD
jgi:hypothetical protein